MGCSQPLRLPRRINTARLQLRRPTVDDGAELGAAVSESFSELSPFLGWADRLARLGPCGALNSRAEELSEAFDAGNDPSWHIWLTEPEQLLGQVQLISTYWEEGALEVAVWLRTSAHGHGYATEALSAVFEFALSIAHADVVEARIASNNVSSRKLFSRLGMVRWGSMDDHDRYVLFPVNWFRKGPGTPEIEVQWS